MIGVGAMFAMDMSACIITQLLRGRTLLDGKLPRICLAITMA